MECAVSTACLYPLETEKSLDILLKLGFKRFEVFANCESELSDEFLSMLSAAAASYGARIDSVHLYTSAFEPYMFFSDYTRRFRDSLEQYSRYFLSAAKIGAKTVVFHGDRRDGKLPMEAFCKRYETLAEAARREGVVLAQENVARCRSATVLAVREMKRLLTDKIKFVLDVKQAIRAGENPADMCDAMGDGIACVHISDSSPEHDCLLPGAGCFDFAALNSHLKKNSFKGPVTIEVYRFNYTEYSELSMARKFIQRI